MEDRLVGELTLLDGVLEGEIVNIDDYVIEGVLDTLDNLPALHGDLVIQATTEVDVPTYDGAYELASLADTEQILPTTGKKLEDDVVVLPIPYYETTNESGGYTVIIG